jgi:flagellar export protein FliJ
MSKPTKGKFSYRLEPVLKVRAIYEKQQKEVFAEKDRVLREEKRKEEELKDWENQLHKELRKQMVGQIKDFGAILRQRSYLGKVKEDVDEQEQKRLQAEMVREEQRRKLEEKMKEVKVIEKDKSNTRDDWTKLMNSEETKFLDDIASAHYNRKHQT